MTNLQIKLAGAASMALVVSTASAQNILTLSTPAKASMQTIGEPTRPPEPKPKLSLGKLRTVEALLPDEEQTYEARIALRYERELARERGLKIPTKDSGNEN